MAVTPNYDDKRFTQVESDKKQALSEVDQTYGNMIGDTDKYYQAQIDASKQWADTQQQLQQEQTDFTIEQVEQNKEKAHKDYLKEQSGAYVDWQKQSNEYGAEAEKMASAGLQNTGFSESSQVSMYNTYQNRVGTAREAYNNAILNYNNAIKDAQLQNNAALAEIAYQALQQQLELSLQGFQYKNNLILEQANKKLEVDQMYYQRYQDTLEQINYENKMAEEIRQFNLEYNEKVRQFNEEIARLKKKDEQEYQMEIKQLELQKQKLAEEKRQFDAQMAEEKRQFNEQMSYTKSKSSGSGGSSGGSKISKSKTSSSGSSKVNKSSSSSNSSKSSSTTTTNNMASILALGYGPISESKLASLLASGEVTRTKKNGQWYYSKKSSSYSRNTSSRSAGASASAAANRLKNMGVSY